jgi:replicative superfamily II helicase
MADFKKLRESKTQTNVIEPIEIFRRLPKPLGINDLYVSQAQVLEDWFERRNQDRDIVIKLNTGGGKTLVGLLIAQSILNEHHEPVIYLSPTVQLVNQTLQKAQEYSIPAVTYEKGKELPDEFLTGKSVLVCTYKALFNAANKKFGVRGISVPISVGAILLDDAHVAFSIVREAFTLRVDSKKSASTYNHLTNIFRNEFKNIGKIGTFDDIISGADHSILEVPYWSWKDRSTEVREFLKNESENYPFVWAFLRDNFDYCHCLINKDAFIITPILPLVDFIPSFSECNRRIFMSATISNDSDIIRAFDADFQSISKPITSNSLAGVSERMILAPELMPFEIDDIPKMLCEMANWAVDKHNASTVVLTPSDFSATQWIKVAKFADTSEKVNEYVNKLVKRESRGPFVFSNRYDGIDLPSEACRLLIMSDLPRGSSEYEHYRANTFAGGIELINSVAQRIEQGIGRGARGAGDYCVVILTGKSLAAWIGRSNHLKSLTKSTHAQIEMGIEISKSIKERKDIAQTILQCLNRNKDWIEYHAETLADFTGSEQEEKDLLKQAEIERKVFDLLRNGYFEKAISKLEKYCKDAAEQKKLDVKSRGWLKQISARIAYYWGNENLAQSLQQFAYSDNSNLLRPQVVPPYTVLTIPSKQAEAIVSRLVQYSYRKSYLSQFDEIVSHLVPEASSNQFEQALVDLGLTIGFQAERPQERTHAKGPDVLWLTSDNLGLVFEAKSRKDRDNALSKEQHGQLLQAGEWFKENYPNQDFVRISIHPNPKATRSTATGKSKALTLDKLNQLIAEARILVNTLCESVLDTNELILRCEQLLSDSTLKPQAFVETYLVSFESEPSE